MNKQKRINAGILLIIALLFFISGNILAQQKPERNGPPKPPSTSEVNKMVDELSTNLSLSETQKKEISTLYTSHYNNIRESFDNQAGKTSPQEMQQKRKDFEEQIKSLLSDEQKTAFDKFVKNNMNQKGSQKSRRN
ncbi:MAG: hypothetical protein CVV23_11210 [Ignavibacteriae bacterium HGW-Ignavibacteriae-2]|jgi:hypothetical protein|nr:hypothetical protein [Bacteroidota bacterium]PKL88294.1 MAG: hypothetical protein CVV23_11210 [Ignavibacteriae bacterium HGW-Ignavibacteriae-2]